MSCSLNIDACFTSMSCETNLLKENNELKKEVKKLSNKIERCYNSKVTFEHMTNQRKFGDMSGLGFKRKMTKGERKRTKKMMKQLQLSFLTPSATSVMKRDTLQMVAQTLRSSRR
jgi:hypothetical protein